MCVSRDIKEDVNLYDYICRKIVGRFAMNAEDAKLLERIIVEAGDGNYIEIGTLYGGSAVLAALVKQTHNQTGRVYAIDPMIGYYGGLDCVDGAKVDPSEAHFRKNLEIFSVDVNLIIAKSDPWPLSHVKAAVILIDGDHSSQAVSADWQNAKRHAERFIALHDYGNPNVFDLAGRIRTWNTYATTKGMIVMEQT